MRFEQGQYETARWVAGDPAELKRFEDANRSAVAEDHDGVPVFLARNDWDLERMMKDWPSLTFSATREQTEEKAA